MKLHMIAWVLVIIGGLNWLLAAFNYDIGTWGFIPETILKVIYIIIGLSALYELFTHKQNCKACGMKSGTPGATV